MWDCYKGGKIFIKNAYGEIDSRQKIITTMDQGYERRYETRKIFDNIGPGEVLEITHIGNNDLPEFKLSIVLYEGKQLLVLRTTISNLTKYDMYILEICPIKVSYKTQGRLFFGDPERCKVLQNVFWMGSPDQLTKPIVSKCKITKCFRPYGNPEDVRQEVKKRIDHLAPEGGYLLAAVHNIQADVPPENVITIFEAAKEYGKYR